MYVTDTLVVIATHGGADMLATSLPLLSNRVVLVVETGIRTFAVEQLCKSYLNVAYMTTPYSGYDTGAYLWAYWHVRAKNYMFMQDSCWPREPDFIEQFAAKMPSGIGIVGWSSFDIGVWDSRSQCDATEWMYGPRADWPTYGIFGPIFYTSCATLDYMRDHGLLPMPPVHKEQQQAMERAWAILAQRASVRTSFLVTEDLPRGEAMERGEYPALTKVFRVRA